jgi:peptidoglycan/LPS O-acetylase OafA/YrhL
MGQAAPALLWSKLATTTLPIGRPGGWSVEMSDIAGRPTEAAPLTLGYAPAAAPVTDASLAGRNARLQHLRGFAALLVLLYHCSEYLDQLRGDAGFVQVFSSFLGAYGVAVFFVLSGYLMARLSQRDEPHRFLVDRLARIYPLMLILVAVAALVYWATGFARRPDLVALTLVPAGPRNYFLGVEWTLLLEMTYYVLIAVAMMAGLRSRLTLFFGAWLALLFAASVLGLTPKPTATPTLSGLFGQTANGAFLMGFLLPGLLAARWLPGAGILCLAALPVAALVLVLPAGADRWVAGLSALLLVAAALKAGPPREESLWNRSWLRLGDASYALYLCHVPVIIISGNILPQGVPAPLLWLGWCLGSLMLALALGRLDIDLHRRLKRWIDGKPKGRVAAAALAFVAVFATIAVVADVKARSADRAEQAARNALVAAKAEPWPSVLAGIDSSLALKDGRLVLRGYGIDLGAPDDDSHVAIEQAGKTIGFDKMTRMRPKIAEQVARPDIAAIRFGFGVVTDGPLACKNGPLSAKIVLSNGKVAPIVSEVLDAICQKTGGAPAP